jgi:hypothetical protein
MGYLIVVDDLYKRAQEYTKTASPKLIQSYINDLNKALKIIKPSMDLITKKLNGMSPGVVGAAYQNAAIHFGVCCLLAMQDGCDKRGSAEGKIFDTEGFIDQVLNSVTREIKKDFLAFRKSQADA